MTVSKCSLGGQRLLPLMVNNVNNSHYLYISMVRPFLVNNVNNSCYLNVSIVQPLP